MIQAIWYEASTLGEGGSRFSDGGGAGQRQGSQTSFVHGAWSSLGHGPCCNSVAGAEGDWLGESGEGAE